MKDLLAQLSEEALFISEKTGTSEKVMARICKELGVTIATHISSGKGATPQARSPLSLSKEEISQTGNRLVIGGDHSYQTWLHRDRLNMLLQLLKAKRIISADTPYFRIPLQVRRRLITQFERESLEPLPVLNSVKQGLISLKTLPFNSLEEEEEDCLCSFIAAAVLFGKITFPGVEKAIRPLKYRDVSLSPPYIILPLQPEEEGEPTAFFRYFLPPPASNYLARCLIFYHKNRRKLRLKNAGKPDSLLFQSFLNRGVPFQRLFETWINRWGGQPGSDGKSPLSLKSFREAAAEEAPLDRSLNGSYPPFLLSLHGKEVSGDSCALDPFLPEAQKLPARIACLRPAPSRRQKREENPLLAQAFAEISVVLKELRRNSVLKKRREAAANIRCVVLSFKDRSDEGDFENLRLCADWLTDLLNTTRGRPLKKVANYLPPVKELLHLVSGRGPLCSMERDILKTAIAEVMKPRRSKSVRTELKSFTDFLEAHCGEGFPRPEWRSAQLRKSDRAYTKPLVEEALVRKALDQCGDFYLRYAGKLKDKERQDLETERAVHKAYTIGHMIRLGFYAGLRASEFTHLNINSLIYDGGVTLCIRKSKTSNGVRNIPLSLIMPQDCIEDLVTHYHSRKKVASDGRQPFFPDLQGEMYDSGHLASEVNRLFGSLGVEGMRFHYLRHAFANWFLLRWFAAFHPYYIPEETAFTGKGLFQDHFIEKLKPLCLGMNNKKGQEQFSYALPVLARLMGHGGPLVTMEKYLHTGDWLFYCLSLGADRKTLALTSRQLERFLLRSFPSLPPELKGRGKKVMSYAELLERQRKELPPPFSPARVSTP